MSFDIFVLDTSPTGHLMRFLELPHLVREWLRAFFRLSHEIQGRGSLGRGGGKGPRPFEKCAKNPRGPLLILRKTQVRQRHHCRAHGPAGTFAS